jgi:hypothetical protein
VNSDEEKVPRKVTDIDALKSNVQMAVEGFADRWISMPGFGMDVEVMTLPQLRDAMGLRASIDWGDPWPAAEQELLTMGFRWHWLGGQRVMFLKERDDFVPDTGWEDAEEVKSSWQSQAAKPSEELRAKS